MRNQEKYSADRFSRFDVVLPVVAEKNFKLKSLNAPL